MGGRRTFKSLTEDCKVPQRGVYFFFEEGENRSESGVGQRVVQVGTHALKPSKATLSKRLFQHRGNKADPGGNHGGSNFRLLIGEAISERDIQIRQDSWGNGSSASQSVVDSERHEAIVSEIIRKMPFVWLE